MEIKRHRVDENRCQGSPQSDFRKRRPQAISPGGYGGKRNIGRHVRKLAPLFAEVAPTLRVDGKGTEDRKHEERAEKDQGRKITVDDEVNQRPECDSPQKRMARDAHYASRRLWPLPDF